VTDTFVSPIPNIFHISQPSRARDFENVSQP
jgi:hypothetical protein